MSSVAANTIPMTTPPWVDEPLQWLPIAAFAREWNRSTQTIHRWIHDGTLLENGFRVYQDPGGKWWIRKPNV